MRNIIHTNEHLYDCYENCICYNCYEFKKSIRKGIEPDCACEDCPVFCEDQCYMCKYQEKCDVFLNPELYWWDVKCQECEKPFCKTREEYK